MKKSIILVFSIFMLSFNVNAQFGGCWIPAISSHCDWMTSQLDDNTNDKYALFSASDECVSIYYNFPFYDINYLTGLKLFIHGGGVWDLVILYDVCEGYSWNQTLPGPLGYSNEGSYIYYSNQITDPSAVQVEFIYGEVDWGVCTYEGLKYEDYIGSPAPQCAFSGSYQNDENDDFGSIYITPSKKNYGIYPTITTDFIRINAAEEIKNVDIIDMNGRVVKNFKSSESYDKNLDLTELKSGMYIVRVATIDNTIINYKILKE